MKRCYHPSVRVAILLFLLATMILSGYLLRGEGVRLWRTGKQPIIRDLVYGIEVWQVPSFGYDNQTATSGRTTAEIHSIQAMWQSFGCVFFPSVSYLSNAQGLAKQERNERMLTQAEEENQDAAVQKEQQVKQEQAKQEQGDDNAVKEQSVAQTPPLDLSIDRLRDYEYLLGNFYTIDSTTMVGPEDLNVDVLLGKDMKLSEGEGPKVLIFHTHSQESFADSAPGDPNTSIVGMGAYLSQVLNEKYGISTLHHDGVYDLVDGKLDRSSAYELAETQVRQILSDNPSIEVVIDLHRDGVAETTHLVTDVQGKPTANIMFFNGMSRTREQGDIAYLDNPYREDNLAFSLQMQLACEQYYPGFARHIYIKGYRYNLHMKPKSLLIEAGAQTNSVEEMKNAMDILADALHHVLKP